MNYSKIKSLMIVPCYGITKFPENNNYAMVLNYLREGNLRDYLQKNHSKLTLKDRITIFKHLCRSLYRIHEKDLIHCDLHSGNILVEGGNILQIWDYVDQLMRSHQIKSMELYHMLHPKYLEAKRTPNNLISIVLGC